MKIKINVVKKVKMEKITTCFVAVKVGEDGEEEEGEDGEDCFNV